MVSSAAVPPCMPAGVLWSSSGRIKGTLGCASPRGARWCSPRGRRPHHQRDPLVGGTLPLSHADQWGRGPPCRHACQRGCSGHLLAESRAPSGAPHRGEHVGAHPVAGDLTANEIRSSEVLSLSVTLTSGVGDPLSAAGGTEAGRDLGVFSVFRSGFELVFQKKISRK